jgi:hypothetical protein
MNIKSIQILSEAANDLETGWGFYEKQESGVGNYFWDCLLSDIESLLIFGGVHNIEHGCYRMLSKRFPYAIYYEINKAVVYIVAILPMRRDSNWVETKLKERS